MTYGLEYFRRICQASASEQFESLRRNLNEEESFLTDTLNEESYESVYQIDTWHAWMAQQEYSPCNDDDGPNAAWIWATGNKVDISYFDDNKKDLRKWAYVMWDKWRLDQWGVLNESNEQYVRTYYD